MARGPFGQSAYEVGVGLRDLNKFIQRVSHLLTVVGVFSALAVYAQSPNLGLTGELDLLILPPVQYNALLTGASIAMVCLLFITLVSEAFHELYSDLAGFTYPLRILPLSVFLLTLFVVLVPIILFALNFQPIFYLFEILVLVLVNWVVAIRCFTYPVFPGGDMLPDDLPEDAAQSLRYVGLGSIAILQAAIVEYWFHGFSGDLLDFPIHALLYSIEVVVRTISSPTVPPVVFLLALPWALLTLGATILGRLTDGVD